MFLELTRPQEAILTRLIHRRLRELQNEPMPGDVAVGREKESDARFEGEARELCELLRRLEEAEYDVLC